MQITYQARYYNGQSSKPFVAHVSISDNGIDIVYENEDGKTFQIPWNRVHIRQVDYSSSIVVLRYGDIFPYQQLEVTDQAFIKIYTKEFKVSRVQRWLHFHSIGGLLFLIFGFLVSLVAGYLWALPWVADKVADQFPKEYEISMGESIYQSVLKEEKIDTQSTILINQFFNRLNVQTDYPVRITVVKNSLVNAYALPGGGIVVYDSIINTLSTPEALAGLLAHEFSHVALKHTTRNVFRVLSGYLFVSLLFGDASGIAAVVIDNANQLRNLSYSRDLEAEADANAMKILKEKQLSAEGMIQLFNALKEKESIKVSEIVSTHPDLDARIEAANQFKESNNYTLMVDDSLDLYFMKLQQSAK